MIILIINNRTYFIANNTNSHAKILFTINSLLKKTLKNSIYNSFRFDYKKIHLIKQKLFKLRTFHFN